MSRETLRTSRERRPTPVGEILQGIIQRYGLEIPFLEYRLQQEWEAIVGRTLALHSRPVALRRRRLILRVDSAPWMQQLALMKRDLLQRIQSHLGTHWIQDIRFHTGPLEEGGEE